MTEIVSQRRNRRFALGSAPQAALVLQWGAASDVGLRRQVNEDSVIALPGLVAVADGLGGHAAGDLASEAAVSRLAEAARRRSRSGAILGAEDVGQALVLASQDIAEASTASPRGSGTTVSGIAVVEVAGVPGIQVFNVGDSRVYRHLGTVLQQITVDHSLGQELYESGQITAEELAVFLDRNVITRAIGAADAEADSWTAPVRDGDRILLCSDGLTSEVPDEVIRTTLSASPDPDLAAQQLVELARRSGGRDNVTVIVVDVLGGAAEAQGDAGDETDEAEAFLEETTVPVGSA